MRDDLKTLRANKYELVARMHNGTPTGAIWAEGRKVYAVTAPSVEEVWHQLQQRLADLMDELVAARGSVTPSAEEVRDAFRRMAPNLPESYKAMLREHLRRPERTITATGLADAAGYKHHGAANLHYGLLGSMLHAELPEVLPKRKNGSTIMTCAIGEVEDQRSPDESQWLWKMRPHVAAGLEAAKIL